MTTPEQESLATEFRSIGRGILVALAIFWVALAGKAVVLWEATSSGFWLGLGIVSVVLGVASGVGVWLLRARREGRATA